MVKKIFNIFLLGLVSLLLIALAAMIYSIVQENRAADQAAQEYRETQVARFGDMTTLCQNVTGQDTGDFLIEGDGRPLILLTGETDVHPAQEGLPEDRKPSSSAEVDVVLCIQGQNEGARTEVGRCPYEDTDKVVIRFRVDPEIILLDPANGARIASGTVQGGDPPGCPFSVQDNDLNESIFGPPPAAQTVLAWLEFQATQSATQDWGDDILSLCQSPPTPDDALAVLDSNDPPSLLILQSGTGDVHPWFAALPDEWRASEPEAVDYVVCAPPIDADNTETQQARTCEFMVTGDGGRDFQGMRDIPVYLRTVHTLVLDPVSGDALGELVVSGSAPARDILNGGVGCPITIGGDELEGIYGEYPTAGNFQAAFRGQFLSE